MEEAVRRSEGYFVGIGIRYLRIVEGRRRGESFEAKVMQEGSFMRIL